MPRVYEPDAYAARVKFAASYISQGRESTRAFDTCFEMYDGTAVALALYRRAKARPETKLAKNLWRYLAREDLEACAAEHAHIADLPAYAAELRRKAIEERNRRWPDLANA